jgi:hypothetical protein
MDSRTRWPAVLLAALPLVCPPANGRDAPEAPRWEFRAALDAPPLVTGTWVCRFKRDGPGAVDEKARACRVYYEGGRLKLRNENGMVTEARLVRDGRTWKVEVLPGGSWTVGLKGTVHRGGKRIDWGEWEGHDMGVWVFRR